MCSPPVDVTSLITCYNDTLQSLLDKHAPFVDVKQHAHVNAPWYDHQCHQAVSALSLAVQLAFCVFNCFSFILFLSKLNDDDDEAKTATHRLERVYRRDKTDFSREAWHRQSELLHQVLHRRYVEYWSDAITANRRDSMGCGRRLTCY